MGDARYPVFLDKRTGNRFIVPSYSIWSDDEDGPLATTLWSKGILFSSATGLTMEKDWLVAPTRGKVVDIPHVVTEIYSPAFLCGGCTAYLIGGPEFDKIRQETVDA